MNKYDAIVIGAGCGGLTAACWLAKEGKKVLLCERHNLPGGFATSFKRGRFEFEASLHELCGYGKEPGQGNTRSILEAIGAAQKIEMCDVPAAYRVISLDPSEGIDASMPFGIPEFIDKMEEYVPGSRESMEKLFELGGDIEKAMAVTGGAGSPKDCKESMLNFFRLAGYPTLDVLKSLNMPKKAIDILAGYWSYLGNSLDELSIIHYISMVNNYLKNGAVIPKDRSHGLSSGMISAFEENGGEVWLNSEVKQIIMDGGKARGIVLADGTRAYSEHIICNCSPNRVFSTMVNPKDVSVDEIKRVNARTLGARGFGVFLGLNKSPEELGIKDHCYLIYDTMDTRKQFELMKNIETNNVQATVCLNLADPDCSPEGTTILYFTTLFTDDCWAKVKPEDYVKTKQAVAKRMIETLEKSVGIKISDCIEEIEISTPMTYARYTDTPQGAIYGYLVNKWDSVVIRTVLEAAEEKVPGLRFAGGFAKMGDGYSSAMLTGRDVAKRTLKDMEGDK